eukprot:scaffold439665_cov45-Prasinocladus_malaysianus.AAC.1
MTCRTSTTRFWVLLFSGRAKPWAGIARAKGQVTCLVRRPRRQKEDGQYFILPYDPLSTKPSFPEEAALVCGAYSYGLPAAAGPGTRSVDSLESPGVSVTATRHAAGSRWLIARFPRPLFV